MLGQVDWRLASRLTLTAGVRFTHERKSGFFDQRQIGGVDLARLPVAVAAAAQAIRNGFRPESSYTASVKNDNLSGQLGLAYRASDAVLAYATYARGAKSGGINITNLPAGVSPIVEPETARRRRLVGYVPLRAKSFRQELLPELRLGQ